MKRDESDKKGWAIVGVFLLLGLLCVIVAGNLAIRLAPSWSLPADMRSRLNPDGLYPTLPTDFVLQPLDPAILTPPVWIGLYLTPGQTFPTRLPNPTAAPTESAESTQVIPTLPATASPTSTFAYVVATQTPIPAATSTPTSKPPKPLPTDTVSYVTATQTSNPATATATPTASPTPTGTSNTATFTPTTTATPRTPTFTPTPSQTPTNTPIPSQADLQITKSNGVSHYAAGSTLTYTIVVFNTSLLNVSGALVSDPLPQQIADWSWTCSQNNGATGCDPAGSNFATFNDMVNLPGKSSIVYTVVARTRGDASGSLSNTASITPPAGIVDPAPGNNSATDTDELANTLPYGDIGTTPDYYAYILPAGSSLTFAFNTPLVVNGHPSWDLVLYEMPYGSGIAMDVIQLQIGDGANWYTIFYWGDNAADTNSNLNINTLGGNETDNRDFTTVPNSDILYPFGSGTVANPATGVVIELDVPFIPNGTYPYFRIISPVGGDMDGASEIDAITVLP